MTSTIKDKPLKKIKADLRITVDSIHNNQINNIKSNLNEKENLENEINLLENKINLEKDLNEKIKLQNNLIDLKNKYKKYNYNEHIDYYLDNGLLLSDYYDNTSKFTENNNIKKDDIDKKGKKTILHFFEKNMMLKMIIMKILI